MSKWFIVDELNEVFIVRCSTIEGLPFGYIKEGSLNVLKARLFNLSYGDFLRMARDQYGAILKGRAGGYITEFFMERAPANELATELNNRINVVLEGLQ